MNNGGSREIQMVVTFHNDVRFRLIIYRYSWNCTRKLSENSNGHNFWVWCMCEAHDISRRLKMNNGGSREIQMVIRLHLDVRFMRIIYQDGRNWTRKLSTNSNGHNFWLGCISDAHDISRRSKMNKGSSREIQMVIAFHSEIRLRRIIYRHARNWTMETLEKFKLS